MMYKLVKIILIVGISITIGPVVLLMLIMKFVSFYDGYYNCRYYIAKDITSKSFNPQIWLQAFSKNRRKMSQDLIDNYLKKGMLMSEVIDLLGDRKVRKIYRSQSFTRDCLQYSLGSSSIYAYHPYNLVVCPDQSGDRMQEAYIVGGWCFRLFDQGKTVYLKD